MPEPHLTAGPLTKNAVAAAVEQIIEAAENSGCAGDYRKAGENPLVHGIYLLLNHIQQTHSDGIAGTQRAVRYVEDRVYRLED